MIVLDTNVVSELMRPAPSPTVIDWVREHSPRELYATSVTLAEILYGIERLPAGRRKEMFRDAATEVFAAFDEHVLPFDRAGAVQYSSIVSDRDQAGRPIDGFDAQIAATCRSRGATLATRNVKDFRETGIDLINPWAPA